MALRPGLSAELEIEVREADTALAIGSGDVPVLATPRLLALAEQATVEAVSAHLPAGHTTVGTEVVFHHRRPSGLNTVVTASARLAKIDGSMLTFEVAAHEAGRLVAEGTVHRVIVDRAAFLDRARSGRRHHGPAPGGSVLDDLVQACPVVLAVPGGDGAVVL